jgi:ABC-type glycerol-3-phosphate transport system permease component
MATIAVPAMSRKERVEMARTWAVRILVYLVLTVVAVLMLFPFLYMFFTALKSTQDVFHAPPRLLPYSPIMTEVNGQPVPVYRFEVDGKEYELVVDQAAGSKPFGFFTTADQLNAADPQSSAGLIQAPIDQVKPLDRTQTVGGQNFDVYDVGGKELLLAYRRGLKRFVAVNDPSVEAYAIERTAPLDEKVDFQFQNYNVVLQLKNLDRSLVNTALVTVLVTAGQVTTSLLGGYAFSRIRFRGRNMLFLVYLGTIMIPFVVLIIPLYQLMVIIGWQGKIASLILPWIFTAYGTFLMRQFFITIPKDLEEAALLDGLGRFGILWRIFVPLSGPAIATQAIITFLYAWNSFLWPLVIIGDANTTNHVVTLSLRQLKTAAAAEPNLVLTGAAVAILPPLILFILAQRYFVEGIASTGVKG